MLLSARPLEHPLEVKRRGVEVPTNGSIPRKTGSLAEQSEIERTCGEFHPPPHFLKEKLGRLNDSGERLKGTPKSGKKSRKM